MKVKVNGMGKSGFFLRLFQTKTVTSGYIYWFDFEKDWFDLF